MMATWNHPRLGQFTRGKISRTWHTTVQAPAFDAFSYTTNHSNAHPPDGKYPLAITATEECGPPSDAAVALALRLLDTQSTIVPLVSDALWEHLNGRGPHTRRRWPYGALCDSRGTAFGTPPPASPANLLSHLRLESILVDDEVAGYAGFLVRMTFSVPYDEHGLDVLTDLQRIVGLGAAGEGELFQNSA